MILDKINLAVGAAAGAVVAVGVFSLVNTLVLLPNARDEGRKAYIAEKVLADLKAAEERKKDDVKIQGSSDYDLCVMALGRVPGCDVFLRPLRQEQPVR